MATKLSSQYVEIITIYSIFEKKSGRATLDNIGVFLTALIANPKTVFELQLGRFCPHFKFADGDQIAFGLLLEPWVTKLHRKMACTHTKKIVDIYAKNLQEMGLAGIL